MKQTSWPIIVFAPNPVHLASLDLIFAASLSVRWILKPKAVNVNVKWVTRWEWAARDAMEAGGHLIKVESTYIL